MDLIIRILAVNAASGVLSAVAASIREVGSAAKATTATMGLVNSVTGLAAIGVTAMGSAIIYTVKKASDLEYAFAGLTKVLADTSPTAITKIKEQMWDLSRYTGYTQEAVVGLMSEFAKQGIGNEKLKEFTEIAIKMGVAWDITAEQAGNFGRRLMAAYNITTPSGLSEMTNKINYLSDKTNSDANLIAQTMKDLSMPYMVYKVPKDFLMAQTALAQEKGTRPEEVATGIMLQWKKMYEAILPETYYKSKSGAQIKKFWHDQIGGEEVQRQAALLLKAGKPVEAFYKVLDFINQMPEYKQAGAINSIFGSAKSTMQIVSGALKQRERLTGMLKLLNSPLALTSMEREFTKKWNTFQTQMARVKTTIDEIAQRIGTPIAEGLTKWLKTDVLAKDLNGLIKTIKANPQALKAFSDEIVKMVKNTYEGTKGLMQSLGAMGNFFKLFGDPKLGNGAARAADGLAKSFVTLTKVLGTGLAIQGVALIASSIMNIVAAVRALGTALGLFSGFYAIFAGLSSALAGAGMAASLASITAAALTAAAAIAALAAAYAGLKAAGEAWQKWQRLQPGETQGEMIADRLKQSGASDDLVNRMRKNHGEIKRISSYIADDMEYQVKLANDSFEKTGHDRRLQRDTRIAKRRLEIAQGINRQLHDLQASYNSIDDVEMKAAIDKDYQKWVQIGRNRMKAWKEQEKQGIGTAPKIPLLPLDPNASLKPIQVASAKPVPVAQPKPVETTQKVTQKVEAAKPPKPTETTQKVKQQVEAAKPPKLPEATQKVTQKVEAAKPPKLPETTQKVTQKVEAAKPPKLPEATQKVTQKVEAAKPPKLPETTQKVTQKVEAAKPPKLPEATQKVTQKVEVAKPPKLPETTQKVTQKVEAAKPPKPQDIQVKAKIIYDKGSAPKVPDIQVKAKITFDKATTPKLPELTQKVKLVYDKSTAPKLPTLTQKVKVIYEGSGAKSMTSQVPNIKMPQINTSSLRQATAAINTFKGSLNSLKSSVASAASIGAKLGTGIASGINQAKAAMASLGNAIRSTLSSIAAQAVSAGSKIGQGIASGVRGGAAAAIGAVQAMGSAIIGVLNGIAGQAFGAGARIGAQLAAGIRSQVGAVAAAASALASAASAFLVPHSPIPKGALRDIHKGGVATLFAKGIQNNRAPKNAAMLMAQQFKGGLGLVNKSTSTRNTSSSNINYTVNLTVNGNEGGQAESTRKVLLHQINSVNRRFLKDVEQAIDHRNRTRFAEAT